MHINDLLKIAVDAGASDLHLKVGSYPVMRVRGALVPVLEEKRLEHDEIVAMSATVMSASQRQKYKESQELDLAYSVAGLGRFRVNIFQQRGTVGMVIRVIPTEIRSFEELGLPSVLKKIADEERGLVLVTGTAGSGKTTTLAAMIDHVNRTRATHVMTIEDPIEFLHRDNKSIVNQREVSTDTKSFAHALRSALRQDPDVILIGEMRDFDTIDAALLGGDRLQHRRQAKLGDRPDLHRDDAQDHADRAALLEDVAAEAAEPGDAVGEVHLLRLLELLPLRRRHDRGAHSDDVLVIEPFVFNRGCQYPAHAHHRVTADLEMQIGRPAVDGDFEEIVDVHGQWLSALSSQPLAFSATSKRPPRRVPCEAAPRQRTRR